MTGHRQPAMTASRLQRFCRTFSTLLAAPGLEAASWPSNEHGGLRHRMRVVTWLQLGSGHGVPRAARKPGQTLSFRGFVSSG